MTNTFSLIDIPTFIGGCLVGIYLSAKLSVWRAKKRRIKQQNAQDAFWEECAREADYHQRMMKAAQRMAAKLSDAKRNERESAEMIAKMAIDEREYIKKVTDNYRKKHDNKNRATVLHVVDYTGEVMDIIENIGK